MEHKSEENKERDYEKISPTAWGVAYRRTFTDIPYSKELFEEFEMDLKKQGKASIAEDYSTKGMPEFAPFFESRYLILNELLKREGSTQILELAAGLSPHGLEFSQDKDINYVEMDLPGIMEEKESIVARVLGREGKGTPENLHFAKGNALDENDLASAVSSFDETKGIAVAHEGFLRYLSFAEKEKLAENIKSLLEKFGGAWITPDIGLQGKSFATMNNQKGAQQLAPLTGVANFEENLFRDEGHAKEFFGQFGFTIESHQFNEVKNQLVSPERVNVPDEGVNELLEWNKAFVMRLEK